MDVLQGELNDIRDMWNVHRIRADRARRVSGIPDELFYIPEVRGIYTHFHCSVDIHLRHIYTTPRFICWAEVMCTN